MSGEIIVILSLILANGFFSLSEMAIVSSRKARLQQRLEAGSKGAGLALETLQKPTNFLSTVQIVITLIGTIAGAFGGATVAEKLAAAYQGAGLEAAKAGPLALATVIVVTTFLSVVLGELVPKSLAISRPEAIASFVSYPMRFFSILFFPVVRVLSGATSLVLMIFGQKSNTEPEVTEEEVKVLISQGIEAGIFDHREKKMFEGVLYLGDRRVKTFMTPRTDIQYIDSNDALTDQLAAAFNLADFDQVPLVDDTVDRIVGMIQIRKLLVASARGPVASLAPFVERPLFVPESMSALDLFSHFRQNDKRLAVIVDEYGGIAGLVTAEDLSSTILRSLADDTGERHDEITRREDGSYLLDGSLSIDELCDRFDVPRDEVDPGTETVAGLILDRLGRIPGTADVVRIGEWRFEVVDMDGNRIDKVLFGKASGESPSNAG